MPNPKPTYTFIDPNTPKAVETLLRKILIEKLLNQRKTP